MLDLLVNTALLSFQAEVVGVVHMRIFLDHLQCLYRRHLSREEGLSSVSVLLLDVLRQLVLAVVFHEAVFRLFAGVRLVFQVPSFVVVSVPDCRELFLAEVAFVGSFAGVDSLVYLQVATFVEHFVAELRLTCLFVDPDHLVADELSLLLLFDSWHSCSLSKLLCVLSF